MVKGVPGHWILHILFKKMTLVANLEKVNCLVPDGMVSPIVSSWTYLTHSCDDMDTKVTKYIYYTNERLLQFQGRLIQFQVVIRFHRPCLDAWQPNTLFVYSSGKLHFQGIFFKITATKCLRIVNLTLTNVWAYHRIVFTEQKYIHAMFIHWFPLIYHAGTNHYDMKNMGFACCNYAVFNSNHQWLRLGLTVVVEEHVLKPTPSTHVLVNLIGERGGVLNPLSHAAWYWYEKISCT